MPGWELFDENEKKQVSEVMETGVVTRFGFDGARKGRWKAREMERAIRERTGAAHALLAADGTAALTVTLAALGIGAGDEVITSPFTFVATFESIMAAGAIPIFAEVDETLCLSPESVREYITPRTKAVMPVHMCGAAADVDALKSVCEERGIPLVEDACQAFGATYKGRAVGTLGDAGCYSFDFNKIVTCGEGGALVTNRRDVYERADRYHDHGHDHSMSDRGAEGHDFPGYNYRVTELHAAIGLAQIAKLDRFLEIQRGNKRIFEDEFAAIDGIEPRGLPDPEGDSGTFITFFAKNEETARKVTRSLKESGAEGVFHWYDNNWHYIRNWKHFKERRFANPVSKDILDGMPDYTKREFKSDAIMSRAVSVTIKLGWSKEEAAERAKRAANAIRHAL
ncbi:MAG: DegT/DnrJ/EryC1/StrS family aminotransferase [Synergistaceae bacterium]|jgi:8-amino-3,8-dideoxy-alpha-D-manno-octulosonate transaminase|nr:DegT/DnrJ/EryC1/StrS family aminotransferase [Synergistaceae bacterium]